jgi:hypothetical protein
MTGSPSDILGRAKTDSSLRRLATKIQQPTDDRGTPFSKTRIGFVSTIDYAAWTCTAYFTDLLTPVPNIPILDEVNAAPDTQGVFTQVGNEYTLVGMLSRGPQVQNAYHTGADLLAPLSGAWGNLSGFAFQAETDGVYAIDVTLFLVRLSAASPVADAPDIKYGWTWTGSGKMSTGNIGVDTNVADGAYNGPFTGHAVVAQATSPLNEVTGLGIPVNIPVVARVHASYECAAAGVVQMRIAQFLSHASIASRVQQGSRMRVERIA